MDGKKMENKKKERRIYTFFDGEKQRRVDPLIIYKRLSAVSTALSIDIKVSKSASQDALQAHDKVVEAIQGIFQVRPLDDTGGLTQAEMFDLLNDFMEWCDSLKKNSATEPPLSPPTGPPSNPAS